MAGPEGPATIAWLVVSAVSRLVLLAWAEVPHPPQSIPSSESFGLDEARPVFLVVVPPV